MRINEPNAIRARIRYYSTQPKPDKFINPDDPPEFDENGHPIITGISRGLIGAIVGEIEKIIKSAHPKEEVMYRKMLFGWLFGDETKPPAEMSSKALTPQMWYGLKRWIGVSPVNENGKIKWAHRPQFDEELWWCVARAKMLFDFCAHYNPPMSLWQAIEWSMSTQIRDSVQEWLEIEKNGIVSHGLMLGAGLVTEIPYVEPAVVEEPEQVVETGSRMPYNAPKSTLETFTAQSGNVTSYVSDVDESEL